MVRAACAFGNINGVFNEYGGNYKMSELSAAGILQWWDQFNIDEMQNIFMKNYYNLKYQMRNENGEYWINHDNDKWFPTCLPFICDKPVEKLSGEYLDREYKKYYRPLGNGHVVSDIIYNNIKCIALTNGVEECLNRSQ